MFRYLYHLLKNQKNGGRVMSNINKKRYPNVNDASLEKIHMKNRKLIFTLCYLAYSAIYIARLNLSVATPVLQELNLISKAQIGLMGSLFFVTYAVVHLKNGKYGLIEIKLGGDKLIEEGANSLKAMESKIDTDKMNAPSFLMVLTGTGDYAYRRPDGVFVVPIGCLKN